MGFGGTGRTRTGDQQLFSRYTVIFAKALPSELLSHITAGSPAGGLCLLSAEIRIERKKRQWLIAVEVGAGFEPTSSCCAASVLPQAPTDHFEGGAGLPRYAPASGIVRTSAAGRNRTSLCHGITALSQPIPRPRHRAAAYYACRLSGCQASLPSALPPRSYPAGVPVSPGCRSALPFVRSLFFALLDHCRRWRSRDSNPGHSSSSQLSYCTISPVSPGCHVSTASRCPPASYGGQHSPPVFWPVNMAGTSCHGISLRRQISLAPGRGIPPAAGRSFPAVRI